VIDNDSQDDSQNLIVEHHPEIVWLQTGYNAGFGRANNLGFERAKGTYLLLLNADTLIFDDVIQRSISKLLSDPSLAAIGGIQLDKDKVEMPFYRSSQEIRRTFYIFPPGEYFDNLLKKIFPDPVFETTNQTNILVGAYIMLPKNTLQKAGGFDADFFMYGEDLEWCGRLHKIGKLSYFEDIRFIHLENQSPFRRTQISFVNRFSVQMQVSNLLWIRKEFGVASYLLILANYLIVGLLFYAWKFGVNTIKYGSPLKEMKNQKLFLLKLKVLMKFSISTIFGTKKLFKVQAQDNIDQLYKND
jgi:GT2 family glycosyltransferase